MNRMLGFCCCCAAAGRVATRRAADAQNKPSRIILIKLIALSVLAARSGQRQQRRPQLEYYRRKFMSAMGVNRDWGRQAAGPADVRRCVHSSTLSTRLRKTTGRLSASGSELARGIFTSQSWSVQPCVRPLSAVHMTAGHNALRGSGPGHKPAFENALALVGCPDRRIDRLCITCCSPSQPLHHAMVLGVTPNSAR